MIFWTILNATLSAVVAIMLIYKLQFHAQQCGFAERAGIALVAAGMVLNIGPIFAQSGFPFGEGPPTPFDDWASTMLRIGLLLYFTARITLHWRNNRAQRSKSSQWINQRDGRK